MAEKQHIDGVTIKSFVVGECIQLAASAVALA
jgi:hypothetical protein